MNVLLMQLFPRQFHFLSHAYKGPHKLDYVDSSDQSMLEVKTKVKRADKVVVLTKFISHSQFEQIPREKIIHADSVNIANLIDVIDSIPHDEAVPSPELRTKSKAPKVVIPKKETKERPPMSTSTTRTVGEFTLTTAVPIPGTRDDARRGRYPFADMEIGESFFMSTKDEKAARNLASRISASANTWTKTHSDHANWKFRVSIKGPGGPGVRCWRVPNKTEKRGKH